MIRITLFLVGSVALVFGVTACGGGDDDGNPPPGLAHDVHVHLDEWSIEANPLSIEGPATVNIGGHNHGKYPHQLTIIKSDIDPANLPMNKVSVDTAAIGEPAVEFDVPAASDGAAGIQVATAELTPGKYVLYCAIPGHYQQGMFGSLVVTAAQPSATP